MATLQVIVAGCLMHAVRAMDLRQLLNPDNFRASTHYDPALTGLPSGGEAATLADAYREAGAALIQALSDAMRQPSQAAMDSLRRVVDDGNVALRQKSTEVQRQLCSGAQEAASATIVALAAAVESRSLLETHVGPPCRMLLQFLDDKRPPVDVLHVGMDCASNLATASQQLMATLQWTAKAAPVVRSWRMFGSLGRTREEGLIKLLSALEKQREMGAPGDGRLRMAEVGVWKADLSEVLLERFPTLEMLLVDPYHLRNAGEGGDQGYSSEAMDTATERTQRFRARATHVVQRSVTAAEWIEPESLDLVFVDGDHSYEGAKGDIEAWWPALRAGGIMAGHDYTLTWPGVIEAVNAVAVEQGARVGFTPEIFFMEKPPVRMQLPGIDWEVPATTKAACVQWPP
eukprot:TRINITY_DN41586_c0_g1_i1.p1 TRINITY_DN41586_c0_g1~~TRINITY_DN41586_c0_g1_i1.p1  ORF type:complete len:402 (+),score=105.09 TRINITY_DN41586_c0_g1_i1:118-1323(+)